MCLVCVLSGCRMHDCQDRRGRSQRPKIERVKGGWHDLIVAHRQQCTAALATGGPDLERLVAQLYDRATDRRTLELAWRLLECDEKRNPGNTGFVGTVKLSERHICQVAKYLWRKLRRSECVPDVIDPVCLPVLSHFGDQISHDAMHLIVQPLLVNQIDPLTLAAGSEDDRLNSLSVSFDLAETSNRLVWAQASVRDPYNSVPQEPLSDLLWDVLPNKKCFQLITDMMWMPSPIGIFQGGRLSELLLDFYFDRTVVRKWREAHENVPLLRSGADFLVLCRSRKGAERIRADLLKILCEAGMPVDQAGESSICDLAAGDTVDWLGHAISRRNGKWQWKPHKSN